MSGTSCTQLIWTVNKKHWDIFTEIIPKLVNTQHLTCEFWGYHSGVAVDFVFQEYDTGSMHNQFGQNVLQEYYLGYFEP